MFTARARNNRADKSTMGNCKNDEDERAETRPQRRTFRGNAINVAANGSTIYGWDKHQIAAWRQKPGSQVEHTKDSAPQKEDLEPCIAKWETKVVTIHLLWPFDLVGMTQWLTVGHHWAAVSSYSTGRSKR